jgi:hypothetical protein
MTWRSIVLLLLCAAVLPSTAYPGDSASQSKLVPVVVELFTSEGCSSCPPADELLVKLRQGDAPANTELILLGEHVDYWNRLGWNDRFSSSEYSDRQSRYAVRFHLSSVYTPQMVIDGRSELVGNDGAGVLRAVAAAARQVKPASVDLGWTLQGALTIHVNAVGSPGADVRMAITEDDLTTKVGMGENGGKVLHHTAVVRRLAALGKMSAEGFSGSVSVPSDRDWASGKLRVVVWVESKKGVLGAAEIGFPQGH